MQFLTLPEVIEVYRAVMEQFGGMSGIRDLDRLESALAQPFMTFNGEELYPTLVEKIAAVGFSLIQGHPFVEVKYTGLSAKPDFIYIIPIGSRTPLTQFSE